MSIFAVFIGGLLVSDITLLVTTTPIYIAMIAAFLITGAGNVINDYYDIDSDKANRRNRPLATDRISKSAGLWFSIILFLIGITLALTLNTIYPLIIAAFNSFLLIIYARSLQNKTLLGNLAVSYLVGSTFLFGGAAMGNMTLPFIFFVLAMLANVAREIVKDLEDLEGDTKSFLKRASSKVKDKLAERFKITRDGTKLKYSERKAKSTAQIALVGAILVSPVPYLIGLVGLSYIGIVWITDILFLYIIYRIPKAKKKKDYSKLSKKIKIGMFIGLLAFIIGALV